GPVVRDTRVELVHRARARQAIVARAINVLLGRCAGADRAFIPAPSRGDVRDPIAVVVTDGTTLGQEAIVDLHFRKHQRARPLLARAGARGPTPRHGVPAVGTPRCPADPSPPRMPSSAGRAAPRPAATRTTRARGLLPIHTTLARALGAGCAAGLSFS